MIKEERKQEILEDFLLLQGSHETEKIEALFKKTEQFQSYEEDEVRDKITGELPEDYEVFDEGDIHIRGVKAVLQIWKNEAWEMPGDSGYCPVSIFHASATLERLNDKEDWDIFDTVMATLLFAYAPTYEQSYDIAEKVLQKIEDFFGEERYSGIKISIHSNMMLHLIRTKFKSKYKPDKLEQLKEAFNRHYNALLEICNADVTEYFIPITMARLRNDVFFADNEVFEEESESHSPMDKSTDIVDFLSMLKDEIEEYEYLAENRHTYRQKFGYF